MAKGCLVLSGLLGAGLMGFGFVLHMGTMVDCSPTGECPTTPGSILFWAGVIVIAATAFFASNRSRFEGD